MSYQAAEQAWRNLGAEISVLDAVAATEAYGADTTGALRRVPGAVKVSDAALIPDVMRIAGRCGVTVYPLSTGRNWGYGTSLPVRDGCVILDLSGLRRIVEFDAELGVVTIEPGVTQGMLAEFLDSGGYPYLVPVTGAGPHCSLLGNALERGYGVTPKTDHFAAVTDIEAVLADGSLYRTALREAAGEDLARLFKWGVGPYSAGLFSQSGFGIVTRMTIALARRPECVKVMLFSLRDDSLLELAVERVRRILAALPGIVGGVNLMNRRRVLAMSAPYPFERIGPEGLIPGDVLDEMGRAYHIFPWTGFGTLYGVSRVVKAAQHEIRTALSGVASRLLFLSRGQAQAASRTAEILPGRIAGRLGRTVATLARSLELVEGRPNETTLPLSYWRNPKPPPQGQSLDPARDGCGLIWYAPLVPMRPGLVRKYVEMVEIQCRECGIEPLITLTSLDERIFDSTVPILFDRKDSSQMRAARECQVRLLREGLKLGVYPYRMGVDSMAALSARTDHSAVFHRRLKHALDPGGLISPGRYE